MPKKDNNIKSIGKVFKFCWKICPDYIVLVGIKSVFDSIFPFINIIFSYLILDELVYRPTEKKVYLYVGLLIGLNLLIGLISKIFGFFAEKRESILNYRISRTLAQKCYTLDYEQIEDIETMELITKAEQGSNSSGGIASMVRNTFNTFLNPGLKLVYAISILVSMLTIKDVESTLLIVKIINNPLSALIILVTLVFVTFVSTVLAKKDNEAGYKAMIGNIDNNRRFSYLYTVCNNYKNGKDIRLYSMQDMILSIMQNKKFSVETNWRKYAFLNIKYQSINVIVSKLLLLVSYIYVGLKAYYGLITIGNVVSYVSSITILGSSIQTCLEGFVYMKQQATYLQHYSTFLDLPVKMKYGTKKLDNKNEALEIEFKDVCFSYPKQEQLILDHINLKINKLEKVAIVGQNGAGKTTMVKLLCRLYEPTSGEILINGINIKEYCRDSLYELFSIVFQDFKLFSYSIKNNVASGENGNDELVWESLEKAGIKDRIEKMEKGIDTVIYQRNKEKGVEISGGEAQKISLARALYKNAPIVILDEPTSALDPLAEADIYERFKDMVISKTSIFISHRMSSCKFCDKIVVLENGKIEEMGSHKQLVNNKGLYQKMWDSQAKYYN